MASSPPPSPPLAHLRSCPVRAPAPLSGTVSPSRAFPVCCADALQLLAAVSRDAPRFHALVGDDAPAGGQSLLELLLPMARGDREPEQAAALLETSMRALSLLPTLERSPRRRDRQTRLALEVATTVLDTTRRPLVGSELHGLTVVALCDVLRRPEEDPVVLLMGTRALALLMRDQGEADAPSLPLSEEVVAALVQVLLRAPSQPVELLQATCELLLRLADHPETIRVMISRQLIGALALLLRRSQEAAAVVSTCAQLLRQIASSATVHGQIINEVLLPELFHAIECYGDTPHVTTPSCAVLATTMEFAIDCRLDLSPFLDAPQCRGSVLIKAAACQVDNVELTASVVRCLVSATSNLSDLPQLSNSASIEGLLALYMAVTSTEVRAVLADGVRSVFKALPRAMIDAFAVKDERVTLPALFTCLRSFCDDLPFASQAFAVVTKHWKASNQGVETVAGYVEIAIDRIRRALSREVPSRMNEVVELCNFLREILLTEDGSATVRRCGGHDLKALLRAKLSAESTSSAHGATSPPPPAARLVTALIELLEGIQLPPLTPTPDSAIALVEAPLDLDQAIPPQQRRVRRYLTGRPGDSDYADYVSSVVRSEGGKFKPRPSVTTLSSELSLTECTPIGHDDAESIPEPDTKHTAPRATSEEGGERFGSIERSTFYGGEEIGEDASDASDADGDDDNGDNSSFKLSAEEEAALADSSDGTGLYEHRRDGGGNAPTDVAAASTDTTTDAASPSRQLHRHQLPDTLLPGSLVAFDVDPSQLEDYLWCFVSTNGMRFPKHPNRSRRRAVAIQAVQPTLHDEEDLVWGIPEYEERCTRPDPEAAALFVAKESDRRARFDAADVASRARTVYQCASLHELLRRRAQSVAVHGHESSASPPERTAAAQGGDIDGDDSECPYHVPHDAHAFGDLHDSLTFDSMFESGNLARAIRIGESEYDLVLRRDLRTNGNMQWFYFAVSNAQPALSTDSSDLEQAEEADSRRQYRFNIINLCKPDSLFNRGLQPVIYSVRDAREQGVGWRRRGRDVHYFANQYPRTRVSSGSNSAGSASARTGTVGACYYTLTFTLELPRRDDTYLIAHSFPYTLQTHRVHMDSVLSRLQTQGSRSHGAAHGQQPVDRPQSATSRPILRRTELCKTLGGTSCELLTISDFAADVANSRELDARRVVVITARVHPGEPQASWMMRGVIDYLVGDSDVARALRRLFVFQLVPMLNPDGVYYGNNRCSLSACDLNRQWLNPSAEAHPTIFHTKQLIAREHSTRGVVLACDLHGHSRKQNVFMYGCDTRKRPNPRARTFARGMAARPGSFLSLPDCSFKVSKDKEATARVVLAYSLEIPWSFTLEASFCGTNLSELDGDGGDTTGGVHFTTYNYRQVGAALCEAIFVNCVPDGSVRERLCATIDDHSVDFPRTIERFVREAALPVPGSGGSATSKTKGLPKSIDGDSKATTHVKSRRRNVSSRVVAPESASSQSSGPGNDRRPSRAQTQPPEASPRLMLPLRKSSSLVVPETVIPVLGAGMDALTAHITSSFDFVTISSPRARLSGKKIRNKKAKSTMSRASPSPQSTPLQRRPAETACLDAPRCSVVEDSRIPIGLAASSRQSFTRIGPLWSSLVSPASGGVTSEPDGINGARTPQSAGGAPLPNPAFQHARETPYVMLPATVVTAAAMIDPTSASLVAAHSPKPPASRLRFRGAGRQYTAISSGCQPHQHRSAVFDLLGEANSTYTYDQSLLSSSAMSLRQRSVTAVDSSGTGCTSNNNGLASLGGSNCRLDPLTWEKPGTSPRTTESSAPSWPSLS